MFVLPHKVAVICGRVPSYPSAHLIATTFTGTVGQPLAQHSFHISMQESPESMFCDVVETC